MMENPTLLVILHVVKSKGASGSGSGSELNAGRSLALPQKVSPELSRSVQESIQSSFSFFFHLSPRNPHSLCAELHDLQQLDPRAHRQLHAALPVQRGEGGLLGRAGTGMAAAGRL